MISWILRIGRRALILAAGVIVLAIVTTVAVALRPPVAYAAGGTMPCYARAVGPGALALPASVGTALGIGVASDGCLISPTTGAAWQPPGAQPGVNYAAAVAWMPDGIPAKWRLGSTSTCGGSTIQILGWYPSQYAVQALLIFHSTGNPGSCDIAIKNTPPGTGPSPAPGHGLVSVTVAAGYGTYFYWVCAEQWDVGGQVNGTQCDWVTTAGSTGQQIINGAGANVAQNTLAEFVAALAPQAPTPCPLGSTAVEPPLPSGIPSPSPAWLASQTQAEAAAAAYALAGQVGNTGINGSETVYCQPQ